MMKLEDIGFYTLSDERARTHNINSKLWRAELILTDVCNFNCPYCRGLRSDLKGTMHLNDAMNTLNLWISHGLKNVRFSGGEPTLYNGLDKLIIRSKVSGVNRIAISTNGSASLDKYQYLLDCGVNDFSISLDACCASTGKTMCGNIDGMWDNVIKSIQYLSERTYVTTGIVLSYTNIKEVIDTIYLADDLGVSDIRIISASQTNQLIPGLENLRSDVLNRHPILNYRVNNYLNEINVRGIKPTDSKKCWLMVDDIAVAKDKHFPCIIYLREGGDSVGIVNSDMRKDRLNWILNHNTHLDPICYNNCLDVCVEFNNKSEYFKTT